MVLLKFVAPNYGLRRIALAVTVNALQNLELLIGDPSRYYFSNEGNPKPEPGVQVTIAQNRSLLSPRNYSQFWRTYVNMSARTFCIKI